MTVGLARGICGNCGREIARPRPADVAVCDCWEYCPTDHGKGPYGTPLEPYGDETRVIGNKQEVLNDFDKKGTVTKIAMQVSVSSPIQVYALGAYLQNTVHETLNRMAIYSDTNGAPDALIVQSEEIHVYKKGFYRFPLAAPMELAAGTYWIAIQSDNTWIFNWVFYSSATGGVVVSDDGTDVYADGFSNPFGTTMNEDTCILCLYLEAKSHYHLDLTPGSYEPGDLDVMMICYEHSPPYKSKLKPVEVRLK